MAEKLKCFIKLVKHSIYGCNYRYWDRLGPGNKIDDKRLEVFIIPLIRRKDIKEVMASTR